jgi:FK506-binding protein 1
MPSNKKNKKKTAPAPATNALAPPIDAETPPYTLERTTPGDGKSFPINGDRLTVHFVGSLTMDGTVFDSSRAKGQAFVFTLGSGQVIRGWELGLQKMSIGERAKLTIAAHAAYGEHGCEDTANAHGTGRIPPDAELLFDVELLDVNGRRSLSSYLSTLQECKPHRHPSCAPARLGLRTRSPLCSARDGTGLDQKLRRYDEDADVRTATDAKHGDRDAFQSHLRNVAEAKYEAERLKKGPKAPTIEELVAATAALSAGNAADVNAEAFATMDAALIS